MSALLVTHVVSVATLRTPAIFAAHSSTPIHATLATHQEAGGSQIADIFPRPPTPRLRHLCFFLETCMILSLCNPCFHPH
ncbi:hypothetical protein B0H14DRAFT_2940284 [Mycena olivaceomarginata]|nr:hypothetical protein B0H14DRAFT_2940284 [Mycena olivaceomarginata]